MRDAEGHAGLWLSAWSAKPAPEGGRAVRNTHAASRLPAYSKVGSSGGVCRRPASYSAACSRNFSFSLAKLVGCTVLYACQSARRRGKGRKGDREDTHARRGERRRARSSTSGQRRAAGRAPYPDRPPGLLPGDPTARVVCKERELALPPQPLGEQDCAPARSHAPRPQRGLEPRRAHCNELVHVAHRRQVDVPVPRRRVRRRGRRGRRGSCAIAWLSHAPLPPTRRHPVQG